MTDVDIKAAIGVISAITVETIDEELARLTTEMIQLQQLRAAKTGEPFVDPKPAEPSRRRNRRVKPKYLGAVSGAAAEAAQEATP